MSLVPADDAEDTEDTEGTEGTEVFGEVREIAKYG